MRAICWNGAAGKAPRRICVLGPSNLPHHRNGKFHGERWANGSCASYSVFTSGAYRATAPNAAFHQEKPHFAALSCAE
jgi:hypothetical protein